MAEPARRARGSHRSRLRGFRCVGLLFVSTLTAVAPCSAHAEPSPANGAETADAVTAESEPSPADPLANAHAALEAMDRGTRVAWMSTWRRYAVKARAFEGGYAVVPDYAPAYESSLGVTRGEAVGRLRLSLQTRVNNLTRTRTFDAPAEEVDALHRMVPDLAPGSYGWLESVRVVEVLGPDTMHVDDLRLIDAEERERQEEAARDRADEIEDRDGRRLARDLVKRQHEQRRELVDRQRGPWFRQRARLVGFPTAGLPPEVRYAGPGGRGLQVVVAAVDDVDPDNNKPDPRLVLWSADDFRRAPRLTEAQFADLVLRRGFTLEGFVAFARAARRLDRTTADQSVFARLTESPPED